MSGCSNVSTPYQAMSGESASKKDKSVSFDISAMLTMCAVDKRHERMPYGGSTLERGVVKHPPYPDLVTGWGV
jgi:hypothetical protein